MKKIFSFIALIALVILPVKVKAETVLEYKVTGPDAAGVYTVEVFQKVGEGTTYQNFNGTIVGQHCIISETTGSDLFLKNDALSTIDPTGTSATIDTSYINGIYTGTGEKIKVAQFKYTHDATYTGTDEFKVTISTAGSPDVIVTENATKPEKEGAFLSIAAVIAGIALIGSVYVISRRSTKLYKM